jgi:predicted aldo/keto reductase-like oxidoreductase
MSKNIYYKGRREFFKKGILGIAGISVLPSLTKGESAEKKVTKKEKKIIHRTLGRTNIKVPVISLGATGPEITRAALEAGIVHLDTANRYGAGRHETMLGEVLKERPRESFVIGTKIIPYLNNRTGLPSEKISYSEFRKDFRKKMADSLKRLQMDYVDILYLHGVETPVTLKNQLIKEIMLELKEEGKTRYLGTSFHHNELILIKATADEKIYDVLLATYNFRQPHREEVKKALAYAAKTGVGTIAMKVMAGAFWDSKRKYPVNAKAALKWVLKDTNLHTTIPSPENFDQLETDLSVMEDLTLTPQEQEDLRFGEKHSLAGLYCAQCGKCRSQCRYNLDIPTMMRSYMYAYGYKNPAKAKETLLEKNPKEITCRSCNTCAVFCTMGFDVSKKIKAINRVLDIPDEFLA